MLPQPKAATHPPAIGHYSSIVATSGSCLLVKSTCDSCGCQTVGNASEVEQWEREHKCVAGG